MAVCLDQSNRVPAKGRYLALDLVNPQTGWLFDPADTRQLTAALEEFADAPLTLLSTMGTAARELARRYSVDPCADTVIDSIRAATHSPAADVPAPSCLAPQ